MPLSLYWKQGIILLYFTDNLSFGKIVGILKEEGKTIPKKTAWAIVQNYKKTHTVHHPLGSGGVSKISGKILWAVEEEMRRNDETTATQLFKILQDKHFDVSERSIIRARSLLGWTFHGSRYCQMIKQTRKRE